MKKKILIVIVAFVLVACGLAYAQNSNIGSARMNLSPVNIEMLRMPKANMGFRVYEFAYKGHGYIYFGDAGVVHNPECRRCKQHK